MPNEYLDLKSFLTQYPQFKEGQIRWLIVNKNLNGFCIVLKRIGRRLYIHVPSFIEWMSAQHA
jgi:hypothetical protein